MADATKLTFPLQLVLVIVVGVLAGWGAAYSLKSDVRDILTRIEYQNKLQDQRMTSFGDTINDMKRRQELQQYEIAEMQKTLLRLESKVKP
jgi:hypothetical protein